jgi:8-oxo-dGTP diphosphatase
MEDEIIKKFGNQLRVRVCGILIQTDRILMVMHRSLGKEGWLWAPPGGGMNFASSAHDNLIREFREETGLIIEIKRFLFVNEFYDLPLHAIEMFFEVQQTGGILEAGKDPEMSEENQIIKDIAFLSINDFHKIGLSRIHNIMHQCSSVGEILEMKGYYRMGQGGEN